MTMEVQVTYSNTETGEHQHYASTLAEVAETFNGQWDDVADADDMIEIGVLLERVIGFATTKVSRIGWGQGGPQPFTITFYTENGAESCPHCRSRT